MTAIPNKSILDGSATPTTAQFKSAMGQLHDYLNERSEAFLTGVAGSDTITANTLTSVTAYTVGQELSFVAVGDNTGAVTINVNSLGAKALTKHGSKPLVAGDIVNGQVVHIKYDGTRFQALNIATPVTQQDSFRNKIINGDFRINQRSYVSGTVTTVGQYTLDRWKVTGTGGVTFNTVNNKTTVTIPSGQTIQQVIEGLNLQSGTYVLTWEGTAQGRIAGGSYGASGAVTASITGGTNTTVEFNTGTVANVQLEFEKATPFEYRPYGVELILCQRYYETGEGSVYDDNGFLNGYLRVGFVVTKRVAPTVVRTGNGGLSGSTAGTVITTPILTSEFYFLRSGNSTAIGGSWAASAEL